MYFKFMARIKCRKFNSHPSSKLAEPSAGSTRLRSCAILLIEILPLLHSVNLVGLAHVLILFWFSHYCKKHIVAQPSTCCLEVHKTQTKESGPFLYSACPAAKDLLLSSLGHPFLLTERSLSALRRTPRLSECAQKTL